jgi:hypothetical protein
MIQAILQSLTKKVTVPQIEVHLAPTFQDSSRLLSSRLLFLSSYETALKEMSFLNELSCLFLYTAAAQEDRPSQNNACFSTTCTVLPCPQTCDIPTIFLAF